MLPGNPNQLTARMRTPFERHFEAEYGEEVELEKLVNGRARYSLKLHLDEIREEAAKEGGESHNHRSG